MILGIDEAGRGPWAGPLVVDSQRCISDPQNQKWIQIHIKNSIIRACKQI